MLTVFAYKVQYVGGNVLIDTGLSPRDAGSPVPESVALQWLGQRVPTELRGDDGFGASVRSRNGRGRGSLGRSAARIRRFER